MKIPRKWTCALPVKLKNGTIVKGNIEDSQNIKIRTIVISSNLTLECILRNAASSISVHPCSSSTMCDNWEGKANQTSIEGWMNTQNEVYSRTKHIQDSKGRNYWHMSSYE